MVDESANAAGEDLTLEPVSVGTPTRRRALWGVLAVVAVVTGAVVVSSGGDGAPPRLPVALGSSAAREAAGSAMSADMSLAWVTYVAGDGLPALGGEAAAYRLDGAIDEGRVRALVDALGLPGDPTHDGGTWHLESGDAVLEVYEDAGGAWWYSSNQGIVSGGASSSGSGSAGCDPEATECAVAETGAVEPATSIPADCAADGSACSTDPGAGACDGDTTQCPELNTSYTEPCPANADCVGPTQPPSEPCPPDAVCTVPEPREPTPLADLPSKDEARQIALDLLTATGMDIGDAQVTVDGPYDGWYVTVEPRLDGVPVSGWMSSVGVGSKGSILNASGMLGTPERLGDYPLIDTRAAIDRLNALQGDFGGGPVPLGAPDGVTGGPVPMGAPDGGARESGVATAVAPPPTTPCRSDDAICSGLVDPGESTTTIVTQCQVQPDGTEICDSTGTPGVVDACVVPLPAPPCSVDPGIVECVTPAVEPTTDPAAVDDAAGECAQPGICYDAVPPVGAEGAPETTLASPECTAPIPYPEPERVEVTLTEAERVLTLLLAFDGSGDAYLLPGYRFSNADGAIVEVAAVADDSLAPTTTLPETTETTGSPAPPATECDTVVEGDASGTTHTIQTCRQPTEPARLEPGQTPEIGVGYYVDVDAYCADLVLGDQTWRLEKGDLAGWSNQEGGTFTLDAPDHGTFVGDAAAEKTATFVPGTNQNGCRTYPPRG